jgi:hypothetical protein
VYEVYVILAMHVVRLFGFGGCGRTEKRVARHLDSGKEVWLAGKDGHAVALSLKVDVCESVDEFACHALGQRWVHTAESGPNERANQRNNTGSQVPNSTLDWFVSPPEVNHGIRFMVEQAPMIRNCFDGRFSRDSALIRRCEPPIMLTISCILLEKHSYSYA